MTDNPDDADWCIRSRPYFSDPCTKGFDHLGPCDWLGPALERKEPWWVIHTTTTIVPDWAVKADWRAGVGRWGVGA